MASYVFCGGATSFDGIWKIDKSDMLKLATSQDIYLYKGNLLVFNNCLYAAPSDNHKIWKIDIEDMSTMLESPNGYSDISCLIGYGEYLYFGNEMGFVCKLSADDLLSGYIGYWCGSNTEVVDVATDGINLYAIEYHTTNGYRISKFNMSNMIRTASGSWGNALNRIICLGDYIYCAANGWGLWKFSKTTCNKIGNTGNFDARDIATDGTYLYTCGAYTVKKHNISLGLLAESLPAGKDLLSLATDGEHVYTGGYVSDNPPYEARVWKLNCSNLAKVDESADYGEDIWAIAEGEKIPEAKGKATITSSVIAKLTGGAVETIRAYKNASGVKMELTGEITNASNILKRGFEYLIQNNEPAEEAEGTEIIEKSETPYDVGEYTLNDYDAGRPLYDLEEDTIFWFRAIINSGEDKITGNWMKNLPTVTTDEVSTTIFALIMDGNLTDLGANKVTKRGMRIVKNFVGSIHETLQYRMKGFTVYSREHREIYAPNGVLIGFEWVIVFERYVYTESAEYEIGEYEITVGETLMTGLIPGDDYDVYAFAENNLGKGFGSAIAIRTSLMVIEGEPTEGTTTAEKTVFINNLPEGNKVIRAGIRYGRTASCNEGYVEKTGEWENGDSITFFITDLIPDTKYYEEPYFIVEDSEGNQEEIIQENGEEDDPYADMFKFNLECTDSIVTITTEANHGLENGDSVIIYGTGFYDGEYEIYNVTDNTYQFDHECLGEDSGFWWYGDEPFPFPDIDTNFDDDFPEIKFPDMDEQGIDYELIISQIKCSKIADQSIIDMYGRRRSTTIDNHLIQDMDTCITVRDNYLEEFQILKLKVILDYDIPLPFERADCILLGDGKYNYKDDGEGVIGAKADGEGIIKGQKSLMAKIRKTDIMQTSGKGVILKLELEV